LPAKLLLSHANNSPEGGNDCIIKILPAVPDKVVVDFHILDAKKTKSKKKERSGVEWRVGVERLYQLFDQMTYFY
jgi:hypothetical protein